MEEGVLVDEVGEGTGGEGNGRGEGEKGREGEIPEIPFSPHAQILQDEPDTTLVVRIRKAKSARRQASNQISRKHARCGWYRCGK